MSSIGLIINERSNRNAAMLDDLLYVARRFDSVRTEVLDGVTGLDRALIGMNRSNVDTLILAGGDGTMQATFTDTINNRRFEKAPHFVAVPCGMTNVIANDCGLQGAPVESLDNFLWRSSKGEVKPLSRQLLSVTAGGRAPVFGCFLGVGAFHSAVHFSRSKVQSAGARRSLALFVSVVGYIFKVAFDTENTIDELDLEIMDNGAGGSMTRRPQTIMMTTTLTKLGAGIFPFWGSGPGAMTTTTIDFPPRRLLSAAPAVLRARSKPWFEEFGYRSWRSNQMALRFDGPFVFDGEIYQSDRRHDTIFETSHNVNFLN